MILLILCMFIPWRTNFTHPSLRVAVCFRCTRNPTVSAGACLQQSHRNVLWWELLGTRLLRAVSPVSGTAATLLTCLCLYHVFPCYVKRWYSLIENFPDWKDQLIKKCLLHTHEALTWQKYFTFLRLWPWPGSEVAASQMAILTLAKNIPSLKFFLIFVHRGLGVSSGFKSPAFQC